MKTRRLLKNALLTLSLAMTLLTLSSQAQAQTPNLPAAKVIKQYPNGEYLLDIGGLHYTTLNEDAAKAAEKDRIDAAEVPLLRERIVNLQAQVDNGNARIVELQAINKDLRGLNDINNQIITLTGEVRKEFESRVAMDQQLLASMKTVEAGTKLDGFDRFVKRLPVKFAITAASFASNVKSLYVSEPSPCIVSPATVPAKFALRFDLNFRKK